jgi:hypothetical protein
MKYMIPQAAMMENGIDSDTGADGAGLEQARQTAHDLVALIFPDKDIDALEQGVVVDVVADHRHGPADYVDRVGRRLLEDNEPDGEFHIEMPTVDDRRLLVGDLGDVLESQSLLVDLQVADLLNRGELAQGAGGEPQLT